MADILRTPGSAGGRCRIVEHAGLVWTVATAPGASVAEQTQAALAQIEANLTEAGTDKHRIVEATVYLADLSTKEEMDEVWRAWIPDDGWPCRACVGAKLFGDALIEIKLTAAK
jgi:enamine deaminase RidA (YjgF/YER057c/UK114 family)